MIPFQQVVENAKDIIVITKAYPLDKSGPEIVFVNQAFTELTGYTKDEIIGKTPRVLQGNKTDKKMLKQVKDALINQKAIRFEIVNYSKDGREYWLDCSIFPLANEAGEITHFAAVERDLTEYKALEKQLTDLATHDPLTKLLNRNGFYDFSNVFFSNFKRREAMFSVLIIDFDHFKTINDDYGHETGDKALTTMVENIQKTIRANDVFSRYGGDEFIVIASCKNAQEAEAFANKILKQVRAIKAKVNGHIIDFTVSIGISLVCNNNSCFEDVLKRCDQALYQAKEAGRNCYKIIDCGK